MLKSILRSNAFLTAMGWLVGGYMSLIRLTTRWQIEGLDNITPIWQGNKGCILTMWHARLITTRATWPLDKQQVAVLVSHSRDGEIIARGSDTVGLKVLRGSSRNPKKDKDKGSAIAFRQMLKHIRDGGCMCLTPDGPRGPRQRARPGAIKLAQATGAPLLAVASSTKSRIMLNSWDKLCLPLPFGRGVIVWAPIIPAPPRGADDATLEAVRRQLEDALNTATRQVDDILGKDPVDPAPEDMSIMMTQTPPPNDNTPAPPPA